MTAPERDETTMAVPVTDVEKRSPLYQFLEWNIAPTPAETVDRIMQGGFDPAGAMPPWEMNRLFDSGYLPGEFGWWTLPDGGVMLANLTPMPGVRPEMFDWWFAWHGLDPMRYKIWDKDDHYYCLTQNPEVSLNASLSMKERYWNTAHEIREALLPGQEPVGVRLNFVPPEQVGFDPERLKEFDGTIVCTPGPAIMVHFLRPTAEGCELRTRFWMGYTVADGKPVRIPDFPANEMAAKAMLIHNVKEFTHLAKLLPVVYAQFKDDFTVQPFQLDERR